MTRGKKCLLVTLSLIVSSQALAFWFCYVAGVDIGTGDAGMWFGGLAFFAALLAMPVYEKI